MATEAEVYGTGKDYGETKNKITHTGLKTIYLSVSRIYFLRTFRLTVMNSHWND